MHRSANFKSGLWRAALVLVAMLAVQIAFASASSAMVVRTAKGHVVSYQPTATRAAAMRAARAFGPRAVSTPPKLHAASAYKECSSGEPACLTYFGGPVMRTTALIPVFWNPKGLGLKYPAGFESEIGQFFTDLAADSGKETNFFSVLTQYHDHSEHVQYAVSAHAAIKDGSEVPVADKCVDPFNAVQPCVDDAGIQNEIKEVIAKDKSLPQGLGNEYVVFLPDGLQTCFELGGVTPSGERECSGTAFCAYHSTASPGTPTRVEYANEPENGQYGEGCATRPGLNAGYATLSSTSHEISESVTDPEPEEDLSWYDFNEVVGSVSPESEYAEVGDMCAYEFEQGELAGANYREEIVTPLRDFNQTIDGHQYLLQTEWDNAHSTCSISERTSSTKAVFVTSASEVPTGTPMAVDGSGSFAPSDGVAAIDNYTWKWGDGTQTTTTSSHTEHTYTSALGAPAHAYTVTLEVTDSNGNTAESSAKVTVTDRKPTASVAPAGGLVAGTPTTFNGSSSSDPDGSIASYSWSFGDGSPQAGGATPQHTFIKAGTYVVTLTVTDDVGQTSNVSQTVTVAAPPNALSFGKVKKNKDGSLNVIVKAPYAGTLSGHDGQKGILAKFAEALAARAKGKGHKKKKAVALVSPFSVSVTGPGEVNIHLTPTAATKSKQRKGHAVPFSVQFTFAPTDGTPAVVTQRYAFPAPAHHKRAKGHRRH